MSSPPRAFLLWDAALDADPGGLPARLVRDDLTVLERAELERSSVRFGPRDRVLMTTESLQPLVRERLDGPDTLRVLDTLADKARWRAALAGGYPEVAFARVPLAELGGLTLGRDRRMVAKPVTGFAGAAVQVLEPGADRAAVAAEMGGALAFWRAHLPGVFRETDVVVETFLEGEQIAVDAVWDDDGTPRMLGLYVLPGTGSAVEESGIRGAWCVDPAAVETYAARVLTALAGIGASLGLAGVAVHAEFIDTGRLVPIDLNPFRFCSSNGWEMARVGGAGNPLHAFLVDAPFDWGGLRGCAGWLTVPRQGFGPPSADHHGAMRERGGPGLAALLPVPQEVHLLSGVALFRGSDRRMVVDAMQRVLSS